MLYNTQSFRSAVEGFLQIEIWSGIPVFCTSDYLSPKFKYIGMRSLCPDVSVTSRQQPPPIKVSPKKQLCSHLLNSQYLPIYKTASVRLSLLSRLRSRPQPFLTSCGARTLSPPPQPAPARRLPFCCR